MGGTYSTEAAGRYVSAQAITSLGASGSQKGGGGEGGSRGGGGRGGEGGGEGAATILSCTEGCSAAATGTPRFAEAAAALGRVQARARVGLGLGPGFG